MFTGSLLLALIASHSMYAADTEKEDSRITSNTTHQIPGIIPLPEDITTIISSNNNLKIDGFLFPPKDIAYVSLLALANPTDSSQENDLRLKKVQDLLKGLVGQSLPNKCAGCLNYDWRRACSTTCDVSNRKKANPEFRDYYEWCPRCNGGSPDKRLAKSIIKTACTDLRKTLWQELMQVNKGNVIDQSSSYKVIGSVCLITSNHWVQQNICCGATPCELDDLIEDAKHGFITVTNPKLCPKETNAFLIEPLEQDFDTEKNIAQTVWEHLRTNKVQKATEHNEAVAIINTKAVRELIELYRLPEAPKINCHCIIQ